MKRQWFKIIIVFVLPLFLLSAPAMVFAQAGQAKTGAPPVEQPLVSEGDFSVKLAAALSVATTDDEVVAESRLGELGIAPRNGWIADYPVTPDIIVELQNAVGNAAEAGKLTMGRVEALKQLDDVTIDFGLPLRPYTAGTTYEPSPATCQTYPNPMEINNTYTSEGPPVVTYYCPPPDYYYLYSWVPCPFWWSDLWFPGFFILHDFHRIVHHHRRVWVITNHFNSFSNHRAFRIDPVERFKGKTFGGIGASRSGHYINTGIPRSERTIFNSPTPQKAFSGATQHPSFHGGGRVSHSPGGGRVNTFSTSGSGGSYGKGGRR